MKRPDYPTIIRLEREIFGEQLTTTMYDGRPIPLGDVFVAPSWAMDMYLAAQP